MTWCCASPSIPGPVTLLRLLPPPPPLSFHDILEFAKYGKEIKIGAPRDADMLNSHGDPQLSMS